MKKRYVMAALIFAVAMTAGCGTINVNINTAPKTDEVPEEETVAQDTADDTASDEKTADDTNADDLSSFPQLTSEDFDMSRSDDDNNVYFKCHGNTWKLTDDSAKQYPNLVDALKKVDDEQKEYFKESMDSNDEDAIDFFKEMQKDGNDDGYSCEVDTGIGCADPKVVSLVSTMFTYFGGAHPSTDTLTYNIDAQTGQFIPLSAVISDRDGLIKMLKDALEKQYSDHDFFGLDDSLADYGMDIPSPDSEKPDFIYSFNPNGLTFYFNPADLSPYAYSGEQIDFTYDELSSILDDHFAPASENTQ